MSFFPSFPQSLGFTSDDQIAIQKLLAAILHLGNVEFMDAGDAHGESSKVRNMLTADKVARMLGTSKNEVAKALTHRVVAPKGEVVTAEQNKARATYGRDAMAKVRIIILVCLVHAERVSLYIAGLL